MTSLPPGYISISSIYVPPEEDARIREKESLDRAVLARTRSILRFGQLQPILVEKLPKQTLGVKETSKNQVWKLVDGQIRWVSLMALTYRHSTGEEEVVEAFKKWGLIPNAIQATTREALDDPIMTLMMEFHSNEDRDDFTWDEKGRYIRRIHDQLIEKFGRKGRKDKTARSEGWTAVKTAEYIGQSTATVSQYLKLTDESEPATQSPRVKKAKTYRTAVKQLEIEKDRGRRKAAVAKEKAKPKSETKEPDLAAQLSVYKGDCREWIKRIPDNSLAWFHWDPPYGGAEGKGGAFAAHTPIQVDHEYAMGLMLEMFGEIWRVLRDGGWIVVWYTPVHYDWVRLNLQGHRFDSESGLCLFCEKHILRDRIWLANNYSCVRSPFRFWVNPYPNHWRKPDRVADGHEIQRFLTKETEPFFLAGKQDATTPILLRSDRGNVFDFNSVPPEVRRHVHHKPWGLLAEILSLISVPGSLGGDAGAGSGSIIEAAYGSQRKVIVAEMDEEYHEACLNVATTLLRKKGWGPDSVVSWLKTKFSR